MPARRGFHPCGETDEDRPILHSEAIEGAVEGVVNEAIDRYTGKKSKVRLKYEDIYEIVERVRKSQGRTSSKKPKQDGFKPFPKPRPAAPNPSTESCAAQAGDKKPNKKNMKRAKKPADHTANTTTTNAPEATEQDTKQTSFPDPASIPTATATLAPEAPDKHFIVRQTFYTNNWPSYTTTVHANICRPAARRYIMHRSQSLASTPVHYIVPGDGSSETQQSAKSVSVETMRKMVWFQSADGDDREVFGFEAWIEERKELVLRMWASVRGEKDLDEKDMEKMKKMDEKEMHAMYEKDMEKMKKMDEKEMHAMYEKEMEVAEKDMFEMFEKQRMDDMEEMQMEDMEEADMEEMFEAYEKEMQELEEMYAKQIEEMDEMEEGEGEEDEHKEEEEHKEDHEEEQKDEQKGEKEEDQEEEDQHGNQKKEGELVEELFNDDDEEGGVSLDLVWQDN
ncbi:hypothetical protein ACJQWK_01370 [Exserohilum turcicum]